MNAIPHVSFIEEPNREKGERAILTPTTGEHYDSVFIQVYLETFITPKFQDWLKTSVMPRVTTDCDAVRIALLPRIPN